MTTTTTTTTAATRTTAAPTLAYVLLHVADFAKASAYYTDTLGFTPDPAFDGPDFRQFAPGEGGIPFAIAQATENTDPAGSLKLYFSTQDIEAVHAAYAGKGVQVGAVTPMPFGTVFTMPAPHIAVAIRKEMHMLRGLTTTVYQAAGLQRQRAGTVSFRASSRT